MSEKKYNYVRKSFRFDGKRYEVTGRTEEEAQEKFDELKKKVYAESCAPDTTTTVDEWFETWMSLYKETGGLTKKSLAGYAEKYKKYVAPAIGTATLSSITTAELQKILNLTTGLSWSTVSKLRSVLRQMFSRAVRDGLLIRDPSADLMLPANTKKSRRSLTEKEREAFLAVEGIVPGALVYYTMLMTGMRPGELAVLQWADIDFENNEIYVNKALESGTFTEIKTPKTEAGIRIIPMREQLAERLLPLRRNPEEYVFLREADTWTAGLRHSQASMLKVWHQLRETMAIYYEKANPGETLADDLVPYCLRHTFCTDLQNAGVLVNVAKDLMGHSNISTTANIYTHRDTVTLHNSMALLDRRKEREQRVLAQKKAIAERAIELAEERNKRLAEAADKVVRMPAAANVQLKRRKRNA